MHQLDGVSLKMQTPVKSEMSLLDLTEQAKFEDWKNTQLYDSNQRANAVFVDHEMEAAFFQRTAGGREDAHPW